MSVAAFIIPDDNVEIGSVEEVLDKNPRERYCKSGKYLDYLQNRLARKMD